MARTLIFQTSILVSGIMCHQGCGVTIQGALQQTFKAIKQKNILPQNAQLIIDAEPQAIGVHRLFLSIESNEPCLSPNELIEAQFKESLISVGFDVITGEPGSDNNLSSRRNWSNIGINLLIMSAIVFLSMVFPPSVPLTVIFTAFSCLTTAFTARDHLARFVYHVRHRNMTNMMTTSITLGWFLAVIHAVYHAVTMPLMHGFSMLFMSFIMPLFLVAVINLMDVIKQMVFNKAKKMHLESMHALFPQMAEEYLSYEPTLQEETWLTQILDPSFNEDFANQEALLSIQARLKMENRSIRKSLLKKGMIIEVKVGDCFPLDCILLQDSALVDSSLLTGEPQQNKLFLDFVPAGAINLGQTVMAYAIEGAYNSTVNQLLFRSNRADEQAPLSSNKNFFYFYMAVIMIGMAVSIFVPLISGFLTFSLALQNLTGILFAVCPCTIAIAHQLPGLMKLYQLSRKNILLRDESINQRLEEIHTVVFDKTGTLTTGSSQVESYEGISAPLWERIYLLESQYGGGHPLAKAITEFYQTNVKTPILNVIKEVAHDPKHRGLSALVQGKRIHIGNEDYLSAAGIEIKKANLSKFNQGYTPVYIAEDHVFKGVIFIKHEIRQEVATTLERLKQEGKRIILLSGDRNLSALGFNQQNGNLFAVDDIHAEKTPADKEAFLSELMSTVNKNPAGVWFIGDGLNDAPCARIVTEKKGISCSITPNDKAAYFSDICLNGSLNYIFEHIKLNRILKANVHQNQALLSYHALLFLAFILTFSFLGLAVSPLIPLMIMASTTLLVLFNACRMSLVVDCVVGKEVSLVKKLLSSPYSLGMLAGASFLLSSGFLMAVVALQELTIPPLVFTSGIFMAASGICIISGGALVGLFLLLTLVYFILEPNNTQPTNEANSEAIEFYGENQPPTPLMRQEHRHTGLNFGVAKTPWVVESEATAEKTSLNRVFI